jgi:hypothetical protein
LIVTWTWFIKKTDLPFIDNSKTVLFV